MPVILTGIGGPSEPDDRAWCRMLEFGISLIYEPLTMLRRRSGETMHS